MLYHCEWGDYVQATEAWDLYFCDIHVHVHEYQKDICMTYWVCFIKISLKQLYQEYIRRIREYLTAQTLFSKF